VNDVCRVIRGLRGDEAMVLLSGGHNRRTGTVRTRAAAFVAKVLQSALANARENGDADAEEVFVAEAVSGRAPDKHLRRMRARSRGTGVTVYRSSCHIRVVVRTKGEDAAESGTGSK
jgi:ribosomal protein L22